MKTMLPLLALVSAQALLGCERSTTERREAARQRAAERQASEEQELARTELVNDVSSEARYVPARAGVAATPIARLVRGLGPDLAREIAEARCTREHDCKNVGVDREYASIEACRESIATEWAEEINAYDCPSGVIRKELDECLGAIQREDCASPFDTLGRIVACRAGDLCR